MPLLTPQDIITFSLKAAGVLGVGQTALAEDNADAFSALNAMLGVWNSRRWIIWHLIDVVVPSTGAMSYTIGPGADANVPRPDRIEAAFFRQLLANQPQFVDYPLQILESREDYNLIALKSLQSWPQFLFYDSAFPVGVLYPWPIPQASIYELHLSVKDTLIQFSTYNQQINLPPEYTEAIWTNLCLRLAAIYPGAVVTETVQNLAKASMATIRGANTQIPKLVMPDGLGRGSLYNIFSDQIY
jgi:hypothetical protein